MCLFWILWIIIMCMTNLTHSTFPIFTLIGSYYVVLSDRSACFALVFSSSRTCSLYIISVNLHSNLVESALLPILKMREQVWMVTELSCHGAQRAWLSHSLLHQDIFLKMGQYSVICFDVWTGSRSGFLAVFLVLEWIP